VPGDYDRNSSGDVAGHWESGSRIAGYRLDDRIGQGGMAVIFRARDDRLGRLIALKILAPALAADDRFRQRFIAESRAAAAVDDPHIIPVFEAGEAEGVLFIAMRYVPGGDAGSLLHRDGPLAPARAAENYDAVTFTEPEPPPPLPVPLIVYSSDNGRVAGGGSLITRSVD